MENDEMIENLIAMDKTLYYIERVKQDCIKMREKLEETLKERHDFYRLIEFEDKYLYNVESNENILKIK